MWNYDESAVGLLIDAADQFFVSLQLFRCCNQRLAAAVARIIFIIAADRFVL